MGGRPRIRRTRRRFALRRDTQQLGRASAAVAYTYAELSALDAGFVDLQRGPRPSGTDGGELRPAVVDLVVALDAPVAQPHPSRAVLRDLFLVGDHHDGAARGVELGEQLHDL